MTDQRRLKIIYALTYASVGMGLYSVAMYSNFGRHPKVPDQNTGNVVPFAWKGMTVFISEGENLRYLFIKYCSLCTIVLAAITYIATMRMNAQASDNDRSLLMNPFRSEKSTAHFMTGIGILASIGFAIYDLLTLFQTGCIDIFNIGIFCGSDAIMPAIGQTALSVLTAALFARLYFRTNGDRTGRSEGRNQNET